MPSDLASKCHSSWRSQGDSWLTRWMLAWFLPPGISRVGRGDSSFWSGTTLGGLASFWRAREVGMVHQLCADPFGNVSDRGEINGNPGQLASPPLNTSYSDSSLPLGCVKTVQTIKPETEDVKKFSLALHRLSCVLVKLLITDMGHGTVHSGHVVKSRCVVLPVWCSAF